MNEKLLVTSYWKNDSQNSKVFEGDNTSRGEMYDLLQELLDTPAVLEVRIARIKTYEVD